jgi:hypothetical protein
MTWELSRGARHRNSRQLHAVPRPYRKAPPAVERRGTLAFAQDTARPDTALSGHLLRQHGAILTATAKAFSLPLTSQVAFYLAARMPKPLLNQTERAHLYATLWRIGCRTHSQPSALKPL